MGDEHDGGTHDRDEDAPQVEPGHADFADEMKRRTSHECSHDTEEQIDEQPARTADELARNESRDETEE
ncbi:MAG: hypothetical protein RLP09_20410 [Sandaracinaceae bacterium]